jgi:hypothetical protein
MKTTKKGEQKFVDGKSESTFLMMIVFFASLSECNTTAAITITTIMRVLNDENKKSVKIPSYDIV